LNFLLILSLCSILGIFISGSPAFAQTEISDKVVILHTSSGDMTIELFQHDAPKTVANFVDLSEQGFYDGTIFHRIIKDFMIQGGDPNTKNTQKITEWGYGDSGNTIPAEFNTIMHKRGIVSMARGADPDSGSSQFFIVHKDALTLDQNYTVFGRLATQESYNTLDKIAELETTGPSTNYIPTEFFPAEIQNAEVKSRADITNILNQKEPQRIQSVVDTVQSYSHDDFGISFDTTSTWTIQEIQKQDPRQPDIMIMGPTNDVFVPRILIFVKNSTLSLADFSAETKKSYEQAIAAGSLTILNEENTSINGIEALIRNSNGKLDATSETLDLQYREIVFKGDGKFYTFTYANTINNFDESLPQFNQVINSLNIKGSEKSEKGGGCLIATAAYGSEMAPQVQLLREIRDNKVMSTGIGASFMTGFNQLYYSFSPTIADMERDNPAFKELVKIGITPMISSLSIMSSADSEQEIIGYGLMIIMVNVGLYFVAPTVLVIKMKNKLVNRSDHT